jgi:hypothetical protein
MKRTKYTVFIEGETSRFSGLHHALLFAIMISERKPFHLIEVADKDSLVGQYLGGEPTPEFKPHHTSVFE